MPTRDTNITAEVVCDYENIHGNRWTCFKITYPRIIMAELNTHRQLSKNSASSRAIPVKKQIEKIKTRPFIPGWIGKAQSGMQAAEEASEEMQERFKMEWLLGSNVACTVARALDVMGIHKQITNRVLEPWQYVTTLTAATEWANFFNLRAHPDAQPEFQVLAFRMLEVYMNSVPQKISEHQWVGPFMDKMPHGCSEEEKKKIAVARCARISYDNFDGEINKEKDIKLHDQLFKAKHMSPFEFIVKPAPTKGMVIGNLQGWIQYRKTIMGEATQAFDPIKLLLNKPTWI